jgi:hypothetical protein
MSRSGGRLRLGPAGRGDAASRSLRLRSSPRLTSSPRPTPRPAATVRPQRRDRRRAATTRRLAVLVQLAVAELKTAAISRPDQETEPNRPAFVPRPNYAVALVILKHGRGAGLALAGHLGYLKALPFERRKHGAILSPSAPSAKGGSTRPRALRPSRTSEPARPCVGRSRVRTPPGSPPRGCRLLDMAVKAGEVEDGVVNHSQILPAWTSCETRLAGSGFARLAAMLRGAGRGRRARGRRPRGVRRLHRTAPGLGPAPAPHPSAPVSGFARLERRS